MCLTLTRGQLLKVNKNAASPPHMDGSVVFTKLRQCAPHTCFLGPTSLSISNDISIGSGVFAQLTADNPCTLQWAAISPLKFPVRVGNLDPPPNASLGTPEPITQTASRLVESFSRAHDLDRQTDRLTDYATSSVTIGRIYVRSTAMRSNNKAAACFGSFSSHPIANGIIFTSLIAVV